ncbi:MAG TPA: hypothetical protein VGM01_12570 [Ktedonobacteraceae bacterium]
MSSVAIRNNLAPLIDALVAGDNQALITAAQVAVTKAEDASELIGRIGLIAMRGDSDGHTVLTLAAASALCRWLIALRHVLGEDEQGQSNGLPLVIQALLAAAPAVKAGKDVRPSYPEGIFPSEIGPDATVGSRLEQAIYDSRDVTMTERLLFGLFGTGADYRTLSIRIYDSISRSFQEDGHALLCAVRGAQVLDSVEWGEDTPPYIHWLAPHLPLHTEEPSWVQVVRSFVQEPQHSLASYRTRLAAPQNVNALPLRSLLLSEATTSQVCQGVYDALIKNGATARGVGSVIALAASDLLQNIGDDDQELFVRASHGLLFASAARLVFTQVQEVEALPLLFTAAAAINSLHKDLGSPTNTAKAARPSGAGGGLIAPALLESLSKQIEAQDITGALASSRRYIQLGHDLHALFSVIGLAAAQADASADQGHTLQIVLAAGDEYLAWPKELADTNIEGLLQVALRAATQAKRNSVANI